jgi:hypothetical protein
LTFIYKGNIIVHQNSPFLFIKIHESSILWLIKGKGNALP